MKTNFKKLFLALVCFCTVQFAVADNERPITVKQLPAAAQQILSKHFAGQKVSLAKYENGLIEKSYDVILANGNKIEFDRSGAWKSLDCKYTSVPKALLPRPIVNYINQHYQGAAVKEIEKEHGRYEVKLEGGVELTFNSNFKVLDIDF